MEEKNRETFIDFSMMRKGILGVRVLFSGG